jgi:hypothetical protein
MFRKQYLSRAESKVWGMDAPIGDPFGGAAYGEKNDPVTAIAVGSGVGALGSVAGGYLQGEAAKDAASTQAQAAQGSQDLMRQMYAQNAPYWTPYVGLGEKGVTQISQMMPYLTQQFPTYKPATTAEVMAQLPANYQFMKEQGLGAVRQASNVAGGGSNVTRAATKFAEDYASNAYQNALQNLMSQQQQQYNQQTGQRTGIYNTLASIANIGQQGAAGLSNLGTGTATNIANLQTQAAQAQAAGQVGQANAYTSGISNLAGNIAGGATLYSMLGQGGMIQNTPYTMPSPTGPGTYNVGGAPMTINVA